MKKSFCPFCLGFVFFSAMCLVVLPLKKSSACDGKPYSYLLYGSRDIEEMPSLLFTAECRRILGIDLEECIQRPAFSLKRKKYEDSNQVALRTFNEMLLREANVDDEADLDTALKAQMEGYHAFRTALYEYVSKDIFPYRDAYQVEKESFDSTPFEATLKTLPMEFSLYAYGAIAYHNRNLPTAIQYFSKLLDLPEEQRRWRSVRAAFMLGRSCLEQSPSKAISYFRQTRRLVARGFEDPLNLAEASYGWQARAEMLMGDYLLAIHHYASVWGGDIESLGQVAEAALSADMVDVVLAQDPLAQRILSAWLVAHSRATREAEKWLTAIEAARLQGAVMEADRLAWLSYNKGDWEGAERWLAYSDNNASVARWIKSKLLLRDGDIDGGIALLKEAATQVSGIQPWRVPDDETLDPDPDGRAITEELAFLQLQKGAYLASLQSFLKNMNYYDATFLAERVLTLEELQNYVDSNTQATEKAFQSEYYKEYYKYREWDAKIDLRYILARRLAREGYWQQALEYYPSTVQVRSRRKELRKLAKRVLEHRHAAHDTANTAAERAEHLFKIGIILREDGQGLLSPLFSPHDSDSLRPMALVPVDLESRLQATLKTYPLRNYSKHIAADYMWRCAQLLPDNNLRAAEALFKGGSWLKHQFPKEADRFYKALVRRNPNLLIAQQADELRWFPERFTYQ